MNAIQPILDKAGLEPEKVAALTTQFEDFEQIARDWEAKAKSIVVTDISQKAEMAMAKEGRKFLKSKRLAVEATRKSLKESSLREGRAIDAIAKSLKGRIEPIEIYLTEQEKFAEYEYAKKLKAEQEAQAERDRIAREAREKAEREEAERLRVENMQLKQEAQEAREREQAARDRQAQLQMGKVLAENKAKEAIQQLKETTDRLGVPAPVNSPVTPPTTPKTTGSFAARLAARTNSPTPAPAPTGRTIVCPHCSGQIHLEGQ